MWREVPTKRKFVIAAVVGVGGTVIIGSRHYPTGTPEGNQCVHELSRRTEVKEPFAADIVFFHGLQPTGDYRNAWKDTWTSAVGDICWPVNYLAEQLGQPVRVLSVSYDSRLMGGRCTPKALAESLYASLVLSEGVGQLRPAILVGHSLGGLIIKQICIHAHELAMQQGANRTTAERDSRRARVFLRNLRLVAFIATPHAGSRAADLLRRQRLFNWSPVLDVLTTVSTTSAELHSEFTRISQQQRWSLYSFGERDPVRKFLFKRIVVSEESARGGMKSYIGCSGFDHINIASPTSPATAPQCQILLMLVRDVLTATTGQFGPSVHNSFTVAQDAPGYTIWELPASHQVEQQVFISRGITSDPHADRFATDLRQRLGQMHIDVVGPHQLQLGDRSAFFEQEASRSKVFVAVLTEVFPSLQFPMRELHLACQNARLHGTQNVFIVPIFLGVSTNPAADICLQWEQAWAEWEQEKPDFIKAADYRQNLSDVFNRWGPQWPIGLGKPLQDEERSRLLDDAVELIQHCYERE